MNLPQSELFDYEHEFENGTLNLKVTKVKSKVPVGFQMLDQWLAFEGFPPLFCEGYLHTGAVAIPLGSEASALVGVVKQPLLQEGCSVVVRDVPSSWTQTEEARRRVLAELVKLIENCCTLDAAAANRQEHSKELRRLSVAIEQVLNCVDTAETLLRAGRRPCLVRFDATPPTCFAFLQALADHDGALLNVKRAGDHFEAQTLLSEHTEASFLEALQERQI